jgi:hypothetical protein
MHSIKLDAHVDPDGTLRLNVPVGLANQDVEVIVVIQPRRCEVKGTKPEDLGWPPGYFEETYGCLRDDPIEPDFQPVYEYREELL